MRQFRNLEDATKKRISQALRGRSFSYTHRQALSDAMRAYWATIPYRPESENNEDKDDKANEKEMQKRSTD